MAYDATDSPLARYYDGDYAAAREASGDIEFYVEEASRAGGAYLEFGCGTGRVLGPVADAGIEAWGIDNSPSMLAQARRKLGDRVVLHEAGMESVDLGRIFGLVSIPFRALSHLREPQEHLRAFENARRHLPKGGRLVFDLFHPDPRMHANAQGERLQLEREQEGETIRRYASSIPHLATQELEVRFRWEITGKGGSRRDEESNFVLRWLHRYEVEHALARAGFAISALYGGFDRHPLADESKEMIFVAEAA
ncbi:MAG: class I SAM-dependent methyltransferase [Planctomycetes bacterium]|nr:class I SAM-dependent methyltransferase [Planctomycetota bacterium]